MLSGHSECLLRGRRNWCAYIALRRPVADGDRLRLGFNQPLLQMVTPAGQSKPASFCSISMNHPKWDQSFGGLVRCFGCDQSF